MGKEALQRRCRQCLHHDQCCMFRAWFCRPQVAQNTCLAAEQERTKISHSMTSRTPSPEYWHPAAAAQPTSPQAWNGRFNETRPAAPTPTPCVQVLVVYAPQAHASDVHPRALGTLLALTRKCPTARLQTTLDSFVGWLLEAFAMPMEQNRPLRRHLRAWQLQLRQECCHVRLKWHEAFAVLEFL